MLPLFDTFNKKELEREVDVLDITSMQTSVISKYFSELGTTKTWDIAVQSALPIDKNDPSKGFNILDRTFQDLIFAEDAYDFDFIKSELDGAEFYTPNQTEQEKLSDNPSYLSKFNYWLVVQCLTVREWFSDSSEELQNFMCWEYKEHILHQEIYFKHKIVHTYIWNRPTEPGNKKPSIRLEEESNNSESNNSESNKEETPVELVCDIGAGSTNPTYNENNEKIETGKSPTFETSDLGCRKWASLSVPFSLTVDAKSALGAVIKPNTTNLDIKIYLKDTETSLEKVEVSLGSFENPIQLVKRYIEIIVSDPEKRSLQSIQIDFYGEEFYRVQLPFKYDEESDFIMHDEETLVNTNKLHPPRKQINGVWSTPLFKTNFRLNKEFIPINNFRGRFNLKFDA